MPKIWLTYAWKDNQDQDVDYVIGQLKAQGVEVGFDRAHLLAGVRLWDQLDKALADPDLDGWALYATANSLASEPCQEEFAYALDRTLRTKGADFRLLGIFPSPMDRKVIPSAIATRLYVTLDDTSWAAQIGDSLKGKRAAPDIEGVKPYVVKWHNTADGLVLEIRPRSGRWMPAFVAVPAAERERLKVAIPGPKDFPTTSGMVHSGGGSTSDGQFVGETIFHAITSETSLYVSFSERPTEIKFGQAGEKGIHLKIKPPMILR